MSIEKSDHLDIQQQNLDNKHTASEEACMYTVFEEKKKNPKSSFKRHS